MERINISKCLVCDAGTHLMPTDVADIMVCTRCNLPYKISGDDALSNFSEPYIKMLKDFWEAGGANVCPDAGTLMGSKNSRTSEEERAAWKMWYDDQKGQYPNVFIDVPGPISEGK